MAAANTVQVVLLKEDAIVEGVQGLTRVPFTLSNLKNPTPDKIQTVYRQFASNILKCSDAQMCQLPLHMLEVMNSQAQYSEEAIGLLLFAKSLGYVFQRALIDDFSISDIISPKCKRTKYLLSAIINFSSSQGSHENDRLNARDKLDAFKQANVSLERKRTIFTTRIKELRQQKIDNEEKIKQMDLNRLRIRAQTTAAQQEKSDHHLLKLKQEVEELQNRKIIAKATSLVQMGKESIEEKQIHDHNLNTKVNAIAAFYDFAPTVLKLLEKVEEYSNKYIEACKRCETFQTILTEKNMKVKDDMDEIKSITRSIESCLEKKNRRKGRRDGKRIELIHDKEQFEVYKKQLLKKMDEMKHALNECAIEHKNITEKACMEKKIHKQSMAAMKHSFEDLQTSFSIYNDRLSAEFQHLSDAQKLLLETITSTNFGRET